MRIMLLAAALLLPATVAPAEPLRAGEAYEIAIRSEMSQQGSDESQSSARSNSGLVERVLAVRDDGVELEYDLPPDVPAEDRARQWQFPVRVLKPAAGPLQLLNRPELESRAARWLEAAGMPGLVCGQWIFTWTAIRIDCDPQTVLDSLEAMDLHPAALQDGALFGDPAARAPAPLRRQAGRSQGETLSVVLAVDPDVVRRERAEADRIVAQMMGPAAAEDTGRAGREVVDASGTIRISIETDAGGRMRRRVKVTELDVRRRDGVTESSRTTETLDRRRLPESAAR